MEIVAFSALARSGKDTAASVLVEEFGFTRVAFADKLREVVYQLDPYVQGKGKRKEGEAEYMHLQEVVDKYGWEGSKQSPYSEDLRRLLQRMGTEAGRETLWNDIWVDAAFANLDDKARIAISDLRFPNEAAAIKDRGGVIVRIERIAVLQGHQVHKSERMLDDYNFDLVMSNDGTIESFRDKIRNMAAGWGL